MRGYRSLKCTDKYCLLLLDVRAGSFAEVWRWRHLKPSQTDSDVADACKPAQITISSSEKHLTRPVSQQWLMLLYVSSPLHHRFCVVFARYSKNSSEPTHCFDLAGFLSGYCPTFLFVEIFYLPWEKALYKHPAYLCLYYSFSDLSLIRPCSPWDVTMHRKLVISQAFSSLDSFLEIFKSWQSARWHLFFFSTPLNPFKRRISVICSQIKAPNGPLFCDSARISISLSFREMKLIREGQRASRLQELSGPFFSLLFGNVGVTVVLYSRGSTERAW